jgi:hypothetical protein
VLKRAGLIRPFFMGRHRPEAELKRPFPGLLKGK